MSKIKIPEEDLIALLSSQDRKGISILYDNYSDALYGVIHRIVLIDEIAEDVLQETFIKIWNNFDKYDATKGRLFTWIVNIARNLSIDKVRSKEFINSGKNQALENHVFDIGNETENFNPDHIGVRNLVKNLSPEQQLMVDLAYFKGYTQAEISEEFNIPLGTVKTRLRSAIMALRKEFETIKNI